MICGGCGQSYMDEHECDAWPRKPVEARPTTRPAGTLPDGFTAADVAKMSMEEYSAVRERLLGYTYRSMEQNLRKTGSVLGNVSCHFWIDEAGNMSQLVPTSA